MTDSPKEHRTGAFSGDVSVFSHYLGETGQAFLLLSEPGGQAAHLRFTGCFEGREVVWDCRFITLVHQSEQRSEHVGTGSTELQPCFIDIGQPGHSGVPLRVCLNLPCIDIPSIRKMIIMIRNYKRLRRGRHEFAAQ